MINKQSVLPIYYQLSEHIRSEINNGILKPGDILRSERVLSEEFNISRMTVRQGVNVLVSEGVLIRRKGSGTFVAEPRIEQPLSKLTSFSEDMEARGLRPGSRVMDVGKAPCSKETVAFFGMREGTEVFYLARIRLADNQPMAYERTWLNPDVLKDMEEKISETSLYAYLEKTLGLSIGRGRQLLESALVTQEEAEILEVPVGSPVLHMKRYSSLEDGRPMEVVHSSYRADRYRFIMELDR